MKDQLLLEAAIIGEELIAEAKVSNSGSIYWRTVKNVSSGKNKLKEVNASIYSGVGGIILFFIELFKHTKDEKYYTVITLASQWLEQYYDSKNTSDSFYYGKAGATYIMIKIYELKHDEKYLQKAVKIIRKCNEAIYKPASLSKGSAGIILALLHLHAVKNEDWIIDHINEHFHNIIKQAELGPTGVCWGQSIFTIRSLCGLSEGTAGIGYAFLEAGCYFDNTDFFWINKQTSLYENSFFNSYTANWADFRIPKLTLRKFKNAFNQGNISLFTSPQDSICWNFGTTGILLNRIRAYSLTKDEMYLNDIKRGASRLLNSIDKILNSDHPNFTIENGLGAIAIAFTYLSDTFKDKIYLNKSLEIANRCILHKKKREYCFNFENVSEDNSLFRGKAGIGYLYLNILNDSAYPTVLNPYLNKPKNKSKQTDTAIFQKIRIGKEKFQEMIFASSFPKTSYVLKKHFPGKRIIEESILLEEKSLKNSFISSIIKLSETNNITFLKSIVQIDQLNTQELRSSPLYLAIYNTYQVERNKALLKNEVKLRNTQLELSDNITYLGSCINYQDINALENQLYMLRYKDGFRDHEFILNEFNYTILTKFDKNSRCGLVLKALITEMELENHEKENVEILFFEQVKNALKAGILVKRKNLFGL